MKKILAAFAALAVVVALLFATPALADDANSPEPCYTSQVIHHDAVAEVTETIPAVPGFWKEFSPNKDQGPLEGDPSYPNDPRGTWSEPKYNGGPQQDASGVFHNGNGHGSWFYREQAVPEQEIVVTPGVDAYDETIQVEVPCTEPPLTCGDEGYVPVGDECEEEPPLPECMNEPKGCNESVCQLEPELCEQPEIGTPETETRCNAHKCVKIVRDGDKIIDREVTVYPTDAREEGL